MSQIAKPLFRSLSLMAVYAGAAAALAFATSAARAAEPTPVSFTGKEPVTTVEEAKRRVAEMLPSAPVSCAHIDIKRGDPHFHVDVRLADGRTGRLNVDARTGDLAWRTPAVLED